MLSARNISFSYGNQPVLQNLSFSLEKGERLLLLGPSGQGKTTLLRLLCGLLEPQTGTIQRPSRLGVVFQEDRLLPTLTLEENLCLVSRTPALARQIGEELGLAEYFSRHPAALSGGQRRRGALGRALALSLIHISCPGRWYAFLLPAAYSRISEECRPAERSPVGSSLCSL